SVKNDRHDQPFVEIHRQAHVDTVVQAYFLIHQRGIEPRLAPQGHGDRLGDHVVERDTQAVLLFPLSQHRLTKGYGVAHVDQHHLSDPGNSIPALKHALGHPPTHAAQGYGTAHTQAPPWGRRRGERGHRRWDGWRRGDRGRSWNRGSFRSLCHPQDVV